MNSRDVILSRTAKRAKRYPQIDPAPIDLADLSPRDASLAQAIDLAVARRWLTLQTVIESTLSRPWESLHASVQSALLVGAAQLLLLDRIPDYAAIDASVEWAKRKVGRKPAGFVNAVLRRVAELRTGESTAPAVIATVGDLPRDGIVLEDGSTRRLAADVFPHDELERLGRQCSIPAPLLARWTAHHGRAAAERIALHSICRAPILLTGFSDPLAGKLDESSADQTGARDRAEHATDDAGPTLTTHTDPHFRVLDGSHDDLLALLRDHPSVRVQDPTSAAPLHALAGLEPELIIDVCAGRGTKTRQATQMFPNATVIASDTDSDRLNTLRAVADDANESRIHIILPDLLTKYASRADVLLADVPCSNTGVLARRPEARYRCDDASIASLVDLQRQILADHLNLLQPSGRVLYATCSLEPEENERQARWLTEWHDYRIAAERLTLPRGLPGEPPTTYRDGGYFALLEPSR